jgi:hypothetical protein
MIIPMITEDSDRARASVDSAYGGDSKSCGQDPHPACRGATLNGADARLCRSSHDVVIQLIRDGLVICFMCQKDGVNTYEFLR